MQKKISSNNKRSKSFTYDEYVNHYFPKVLKNNNSKVEKPSEIGISLARTSLCKIQKTLSI